jgi:hypothetical protein
MNRSRQHLLFGIAGLIVFLWPAAARTEAPANRFVTGSGTVYDNKTKLTWMQPTTDDIYTWEEAKSHCAGQGAGWRLPTLKELYTIVDVRRWEPAADTNYFPDTRNDWYWSSTPLYGSPNEAWFINFSLGIGGHYGVTDENYVRCVR